MAVFHGSAGSLKVGSTAVAQVQEWTVTLEKEMVETTSLGQGARTYSAGLLGWEGSCEAILSDSSDSGYYDFNSALKAGAEISIAFLSGADSDDDDEISGNVLVTSVETVQVFDDIARISVSFTGTGDCTIS